MSLRESNLRLALTKAIADTIAEHLVEMRQEHFEALLEQYTENGIKQFSVKLPDGTKAATVTLSEQKAVYEVTDAAKFLDWARAKRPEAIETIQVPAQEAYEYDQVNKRAEERLLKSLDHQGDLPFDAVTGEIVEGVTYRPAGRPKSFSIRFETDGRAKVLDAWRVGDLAEIAGTDVLPRITAGGES